jgi:hypothetical protein
MIIGILWWTWRTGKEIRLTLLGRWFSIISLIRDPKKFVTHYDNDTYIIWNATNKDDITTLIQKADILIDATSVWFFHHTPTSLYSSVAQAIVDAWPAWKATHCIVMSSAWTHHGRRLPWPANRGYEFFLGDVANDKEKAEALLEASPISRTIIKSPILTSGKAKSYKEIPFANYTPSLFDSITRKTLGNMVNDIINNTKKWQKQKIVAYAL